MGKVFPRDEPLGGLRNPKLSLLNSTHVNNIKWD